MAALGADPRQVFKTLVARVDGALTVAVVPVSGTLDLKALAAAAGGRKAAMADPADAERTTGYVLRRDQPARPEEGAADGRRRVRAGLRRRSWSAPGKRGLQVELPPADLVRLTRARTAPIGR